MNTPTTQREADERARIEAAAKEIYRLFSGSEFHPWREGGNSNMQDEARRYARAAIDQSTRQAAPEAPLCQWPTCQPGNVQQQIAKEVADSLYGAEPEAPAAFDTEFLSKRLTRVAKLAGVSMPDHMTHEQIVEVAGTILGEIARKLESAATDQPSARLTEDKDDGVSATYAWLGRATRSRLPEVEHAARTMMAYYQGAEFPDQPCAGQVDIERLREIGAAWMSEEGRDALEDWIASLTPTAPQAADRDVCAEMRALCSYCGGTGDVHSVDGEWRGRCTCSAGAPQAASQQAGALESLYNSLPDILPHGAYQRFQKSGKWATGQGYALRGIVASLEYRADDMEIVYAAMDEANAAITKQGAPQAATTASVNTIKHWFDRIGGNTGIRTAMQSEIDDLRAALASAPLPAKTGGGAK